MCLPFLLTVNRASRQDTSPHSGSAQLPRDCLLQRVWPIGCTTIWPPLIYLTYISTARSNMAVLDAFPGLTTEIIVNKVPLAKFHDDETEASPTENTKYIEARSGSEFMIRTTFSEPFPTVHGVEISVRVDGNPGPLSAVKPDDQLYLDSTEIKGVSFSQDGKRYRQNYQFAELHIGLFYLTKKI